MAARTNKHRRCLFVPCQSVWFADDFFDHIRQAETEEREPEARDKEALKSKSGFSTALVSRPSVIMPSETLRKGLFYELALSGDCRRREETNSKPCAGF